MTTYKPPKKQVSTYTKGRYTSPRRVSHYAGKKAFGSKIKNLFTIPEEDLKEEECKKKFDTYKVFTLTRANIFIGILVFMLIINLLITFDVNFLYLRQILGFLFLISVPGLLIMLCFKIKDIGFWEYLVYTIGISIAFIMFAGLAVNWTLPALGITDKPLSLWPILICFNIFLLALWVTAINRNHDFKPKPFLLPKLDFINNLFFIIPIFFPLLSILGAFILNNHGPNFLTMIMLGAIAVYVLLITLFRKRLNHNIYPWALWLIGLSLLLSGWMRSWFVSGPDISLEYWVFQLTKRNSIWVLSNFNNAYNAMLSLTILPKIFLNFMDINDQFIFKLIIPIIFSIIFIIIYLISKKFLPSLCCFFSVLLFLSLPSFVNWYSIPIRQEIAFIFFGLMILTLFTKDIKPIMKKALFVIFGASMIVSHYSTAYIALALFTLTYIFNLIYRIHENQKIKKGKLYESQKTEFYLTGALVFLLLIFGFLWYSQVTPIGDGLINFAGKSISNLENIFNEDTWQGGVTDPILGMFNKPQTLNLIEEYKNQTLEYDLSSKSDGFSKESYSQYQIKYMGSKTLKSKINFINLITLNYYLKQIITKIFQLFILLGVFYIIVNRKFEKNLKSLFIGASSIMFLSLFLPFFSISYSLGRFIQQMLVILAPLSILGGKFFFDKLKIRYSFTMLALLIILFLLFSGFSSQVIGGDSAKTQLNNFGTDYDANYMLTQDCFGANFLDINKENFKIYADAISVLKINSCAVALNSANVNKDIMPNTISKKGYIYLSTINKINNMGFFSIKSTKISYNFPTQFLNDNKNKIYNNGGSEIFK